MFRETRGFGNPVLDEQYSWQELNQHKKRVRAASGIVTQSLDTKAIAKINKEKTWQNEEQRLNEIELQNRKLFNKIKTISSTCKIESNFSPKKPHHSLTARISDRVKQIEAVQRQNTQILNRLQNVTSLYNAEKWKKERLQTEKILQNKCKYDHIFKTVERSQTQTQNFLQLPVIELKKTHFEKHSNLQPVLVVNEEQDESQYSDKTIFSPTNQSPPVESIDEQKVYEPVIKRRRNEKAHKPYISEPQSMFCEDPKVLKILQSRMPLSMSGDFILPMDRQVLWRNLCMIGMKSLECIIEFSKSHNKFNICGYDLAKDEYHVVQLFDKQAQKLFKSCDSDFQKLLQLLDFNKYNKLCIKDIEKFLNSEIKDTYENLDTPTKMTQNKF